MTIAVDVRRFSTCDGPTKEERENQRREVD